MPAKQLKTFLDEAGVDYMCLSHPPAFTAQELAHHVKIAGDRVVKTVIIELDGKMKPQKQKYCGYRMRSSKRVSKNVSEITARRLGRGKKK